jgi:hypothetical protein
MPLPDVDSVIDWGAQDWVNPEAVVDPTSELDAEVMKEIAADVAGATHTVDRAWCRIVGTATTGDVTIQDHEANWGTATAVKPSCNHTGSFTYVFTWPTTITDDLGVTRTLLVRMPHAEAANTSGMAKVWSWTANTITVNTMLANGGVSPLAGAHIFVSWR